MDRGGKWGFRLRSRASLVKLDVSHEAERVRGGGRKCVVGGSRWARGGRSGDSGWGEKVV